jgi:hypothetical protein
MLIQYSIQVRMATVERRWNHLAIEKKSWLFVFGIPHQGSDAHGATVQSSIEGVPKLTLCQNDGDGDHANGEQQLRYQDYRDQAPFDRGTFHSHARST